MMTLKSSSCNLSNGPCVVNQLPALFMSEGPTVTDSFSIGSCQMNHQPGIHVRVALNHTSTPYRERDARRANYDSDITHTVSRG